MASHAFWPQQHPSSFPVINQRSPRKPTRHLHDRIPRQYLNLLRLHGPALGPCVRSTQMAPGSWTVCEPQEVQVPHGHCRVPRFYTDTNRAPHGPDKGSSDPELAGTMKCLQCTVFPQIHKFLLPLHCGILTTDPPTNELVQESHTLGFQQEGSHHILNIEECILHSTSTVPLGPRPLDDNGNGCIRPCDSRDTIGHHPGG